MPNMPTPEQVILRVLQLVHDRVGKPINRTHLVKLVYMVDFIHSQTNGGTLTGLQYTRDNYGPNARDNQIVRRAEALQDAGLISINEIHYASDRYTFLYEWADCPSRPLDPLPERIVSDVVDKYGSKDWTVVVAASKQTKPYLEALQNHILDFGSPSEAFSLIRADIERKEAAGLYNNPGAGAGLSELKARYGLSG